MSLFCRRSLACWFPVLTVAAFLSDARAQLVELEPTEVVAPRTETRWVDALTAISVVDTAGLEAERDLSLNESLNRVPGVLAQNSYNFAQGLRVSIRGFGARASFGVRGVRLLVDGVPLTMPDGQSETDGYDLSLVDRVEIIRGPASTLYGNAAGGVVSLSTIEPSESLSGRLDLGGGELGYEGLRARVGGGQGAWRALAALNRTRVDGAREHGQARSDAFSGKLSASGAFGQLRLNLNAVDIESQDPGGLNAGEVVVDRGQAAPFNLQFNAGETIRQQRLSLSWNDRGEGPRETRAWAYAGERDFANRLPFENGGQVAFERRFGGAGAQLGVRSEALGRRQHWLLGLDLEAQRDDRHRYVNGDAGLRGEETLHQLEKAEGAGLFGNAEFELSERWEASLGVRYTRLKLSVDDRFLDDGDDSGSRKLDEMSLSAGLGLALGDTARAYARISDSFESPTVNELANPNGGGFNPDLEAAQALNQEIGIKGESRALSYELALYRIALDDELLAYELPDEPGRSYYRNIGESSREGVEASLEWRLAPSWALSLAYSYARNQFERYTLDDVDFAGKDLPGLPRQQGFAELRWQRGIWTARANVQALSSQYADDANGVEVGGYALTNLRLACRLPLAGVALSPYLGVDNVFDREYYDNLRINAGFGRYFEPGPGRSVYAGVSATF